MQWLVAAFNGKVLKPADIVPPGVLGSAARKQPRAMTPEEEARHMEHTGRFMDDALMAVFGR